jgi:gamma-glutamyltranspeptidase / glutathione hydrolase
LQEVADKLDFREFYSFYLGAIHAALKPKTGGNFQSIVEIFRDGIAAGS